MSDSAFNASGTDSLSNPWNFSKLMPGLEFLQQWTKSARAAMPSMGQWVAPTLDPDELEKRINDLRTVQFWLEQNARMIAMSIQALEVQRMTLSTLRGMNVSADTLRDTLRAHPGAAPQAAPQAAPPTPNSPFTSAFASAFRMPGAPAPAATPEPHEPAPSAPRTKGEGPGDSDDAPAAPAEAAPGEADDQAPADGGGAVDPMRWWGSLTQQFAQLASHAMQDALKEGPATAAKVAAGMGMPMPGQAAPEATPKAAPQRRRAGARAHPRPGAKAAAGKPDAKAAGKAPARTAGKATGKVSSKAPAGKSRAAHKA